MDRYPVLLTDGMEFDWIRVYIRPMPLRLLGGPQAFLVFQACLALLCGCCGSWGYARSLGCGS